MEIPNSDLNQKISQIMSNPESMKQIQQLGAMLGLNTDTDKKEDTRENRPEENKQPHDDGNDNNKHASVDNSFDSLLGNSGLSPEAMNSLIKILPLLSSVNNKDNKNTALLEALRPFLSEKRQKKLDEASKLLTILNILPILKQSGLF